MKNINSPFVYGKIVRNESFTNRENDISKLYSNLVNGINTMIISPRRWGKSSLVEKTAKMISDKEENTKIVLIDLFSANTQIEFLEIFAKEVIKASSSKIEEWVRSSKDFFKNIIPRFSFGTDPMNDFNVSFDLRDVQENLDEILNLPEIICEKKKIKIIICIDEFQNLANFTEYENFEKKLRAVWQKQKNTTYCLYGSKRHLMEEIFNNHSKPFYRFGDIILLQKIQKNKWINFITDSFNKTGKTISEENAGLIADLMQNHPWYVQQLCHYCWNMTDKIVDEQIINNALEEVINSNSPLFQREIEILSNTQLNLLKAVINNESQFTATSVMTEYKLGTPANVSKNKAILKKNDILDEINNKLEFVDPAFYIWFQKIFLKTNNSFTR